MEPTRAHRWLAAVLVALLGVVLPWPAPAAADDLPPITDRHYAIDLYQGAALGSVRIVGMGGASVALGDGAASIPANAAATAIRPATSRRTWDWDWNIDWLNPRLGSDFDNNGEPAATGVGDTLVLTGGVVGRYRGWAVGLNAGVQTFTVDSDGERIEAQTLVARFAVAHDFEAAGVSVGLAARTGEFGLNQLHDPGQRADALFQISGGGAEAGALWHPAEQNLRLGASVALPITGENVQSSACDPEKCHGYMLPERVAVPWQAAAGAAWRFAATPWNRRVATRWRDERSLLVAADVAVTGSVVDGSGLEAFVDKKLQPSGRHASVSVRGGAEWEWKPGWLRLRGGAYWEPGRFEAVSGRLHGTGGFEVRFWSFCFWRERYRARLSLTGDFAARYGNVGVSIGLWH